MTVKSEMAAVIDAAADLIQPEGKWIQGEIARNRGGEAVTAHHPTACQWCAFGAIISVITRLGGYDYDILGAVLLKIQADVGAEVLVEWNDDPARTQAEVVNAFRDAAHRLRIDP